MSMTDAHCELSAQTFKRRFGVSKFQHTALTKLKDGEIKRRDASNLMQQLHRLVENGYLETVPNATDDLANDTWRLTPSGRALIDSWS